MSSDLQQDQSEFNVIFVHSAIDDYPLTTEEFRVYAHIARRAGLGEAWPAIASVAKKCRIKEETARQCLRNLTAYGLISVEERGQLGKTNLYRLTRQSVWKSKAEVEVIQVLRRKEGQAKRAAKKQAKADPSPETGGVPNEGGGPEWGEGEAPRTRGGGGSRMGGAEVNPLKLIPSEVNPGGVSNVKENARAQAREAGRPAPGLVSAPRTTTDDAALQKSVAPERTLTTQALLEPPDTLTSQGPVPPGGGAAHAASDLALTDDDLDELFAPGNADDTSREKVPAAAGGAALAGPLAAPALRVADLMPVPRLELAERPAAMPSSPEYRMIRSLVTGKQLDGGLLEQATPTGGLSRQDWLRLTLYEIGLVKAAAQSEAQAEGTGFVTLAIRGLDRLIGAVRRETPIQTDTGGANPDTVAKYDPKLPVGARCTVGGQPGVIWKVTHAAYLVDRDDGERVTVDRAVAAQLRRLKASTAPAPSGPVIQPAQPDALGAVGSTWHPKTGGDHITVTAIEGAARIMSDGTRLPVYTLTSKYTPA